MIPFMTKRTASILFALLLVTATAACGNNDAETTTAGDEPTTDAGADEAPSDGAPSDEAAPAGGAAGTATFRGEVFELSSPSCGAAPEDGRQWFAGTSDYTIDLRIRDSFNTFSVDFWFAEDPDDLDDMTMWSAYSVPDGALTATDDSISGEVELSEDGYPGEGDPDEPTEMLEFDFSC